MKLLKSILLGFLGISAPMIAGGIIAGVVQQQIAREDAQRFTGFKFIHNSLGSKILTVDTSGISNVIGCKIVGPTSNQSVSDYGLVFQTPGYYEAWVTVEYQPEGSNSSNYTYRKDIQIGGAYITEGCWK